MLTTHQSWRLDQGTRMPSFLWKGIHMDHDRFLISLGLFFVIVLAVIFWGANVLVPTYKFILLFVESYGRGIAAVGLMVYFGFLGGKVVRQNVELTKSTVAKLSDDHANSIRKLITDGETLRAQLTKALADYSKATGTSELYREQLGEVRKRLVTVCIDNDAFKAEIDRLKKVAMVAVPAPSEDQQAHQAKLKAMSNDVVGNEVA